MITRGPHSSNAPAGAPANENHSLILNERVAELIGAKLRAAFAPITDAPIPPHFLELIQDIAQSEDST